MNPYRMQDRVESARIAAAEAEEFAYMAADEEFGPDWEENCRDEDFTRFVSYWDIPVATDDERDALARTMDVEQYHI